MRERAQVLAAIPPFAMPTLERALGSYVELIGANYFNAAREILAGNPRVALILGGVHFDESRMYDLLSYARQKYPGIPFICCRILDAEIPRISRQAIAIAAKTLGASEFIDLPALSEERGAEAAEQELRSLVLAHLQPGSASAVPRT